MLHRVKELQGDPIVAVDGRIGSLEMLLEPLGHEVDVVHDGPSALAAAHAKIPGPNPRRVGGLRRPPAPSIRSAVVPLGRDAVPSPAQMTRRDFRAMRRRE